MGKDVFYFSHDSNARNDDKIVEIRIKYGWEGYGIYFAIIEILREQENYAYPGNAIAKLSFSLSIDSDKFKHIYKDLLSTGLLIEKNGVVYSESLMQRMEKIDKTRAARVEAGRKGGKAKAKLKQSSSKKQAKSSKENKVKENKVNKFIIPTHEEIKNYSNENNYIIDVSRFYDFYESKGWMVGKNKMKDWKAAVRNWCSNKKYEKAELNFNQDYSNAAF